jgi:hypothetical protein
MPVGSVCCNDGSSTSCPSGDICIPGGCCPIGSNCTDGGGTKTITLIDPAKTSTPAAAVSSGSTGSSGTASQGGAVSTTSQNTRSTATTARAPTPSAKSASSSSGLSTGAKIAIGVVIPVVFIMLLLGLFFFFRRRRRRQDTTANQLTWPEDAKSPGLDGTMRNELEGDASRRPAELEDMPSPRSELEAFPSPTSQMSPVDVKRPAELG